MDSVPGETRTLRRTMRDLVALSALPAVWAGCPPAQIADGLVDVLRTHPVVIIGGTLQQNPFFVPPDEFLRELRERAGQNSTSVG